MSGMRQKIQYSLALEPAHQGETPVGGCQGTEPLVAKPAPQSPALAPTSCRCHSLTPSNRRVRDPYARWCGRGGTARCPPIPIIGALPFMGRTKRRPAIGRSGSNLLEGGPSPEFPWRPLRNSASTTSAHRLCPTRKRTPARGRRRGSGAGDSGWGDRIRSPS
jgi:hypothetical protein